MAGFFVAYFTTTYHLCYNRNILNLTKKDIEMADEKAKQAKPKTQRKAKSAKAAPSVDKVKSAADKLLADVPSKIPARVTWQRYYKMGIQDMVDALNE